MTAPAKSELPPGSRILLTSDAVGGVFSYSATLARQMCSRGASVSLVLMGPTASQSKIASLRDIAGLDLIVTDLALEWQDIEGRDATRGRRELEAIIARTRPDVVHLCGFRDALIECDAPVVVTAHSCVASWWRACRGGEPDRCCDGYSRNVKAGLDAADAWIAPSHAFQNTVEDLYTPKAPGFVVYNGISPMGPGRSARPVIFAAGRLWDEAKDVRTIVAAASETRWPVEIAGPDRNEDGSRVDGGATTLLGEVAQRELLGRMADAAVFVSAAVYEPFGLSVLEAAASGCALVLADIPSFRELWDDAALFFAPRDQRDLAKQINRLCDDAALCAAMRASAITRAQRYTATRFADGTIAVYRAVIASSRKTASTVSLRKRVPA